MSKPAVELLSRVSACPNNTQGTLISISVNASSHFQWRNAGASAFRCSAMGSSNNEPMQRAHAGDHQRVDFLHGDANQQVGHAPQQAQREKQDPAAL